MKSRSRGRGNKKYVSYYASYKQIPIYNFYLNFHLKDRFLKLSDSGRNYLKYFIEEEKILLCLEAGPEKALSGVLN